MTTIGGPAQPVVSSTEAPDGGPARPVAVVTAPLYTLGGPPVKVVEVSDNRPRQAGPAMPIVVASGAAAAQPMAGPPIPVYVVSGSLNPSQGAALLQESGHYLLQENGSRILLEP